MLTEAEMFDCEERWDDGVSNPLHSRLKRQLSVEEMFDTEENWDEGIFLLTASRSQFIQCFWTKHLEWKLKIKLPSLSFLTKRQFWKLFKLFFFIAFIMRRYHYRPQTKFAKVMFLDLSVILFTGGVVSQHALQVSRPTPRGEVEGSGLGGSPGPHFGGSPGPHLGGLQAHTWRGLQVHTQGGIPACTEADTPPADGYCCRWYASYWNAFLLTLK